MTSTRAHWLLDPAVTFLNHGSFGACPRDVLGAQQGYRLELERQPVQFFIRRMQPLLDESRQALSTLLHADADDLALVNNATTGVNSVVRSLEWSAGDELLVTDHAYNACRNALEFVAQRAGVRLVVARVPFPISSPDEAVAAIMRCVCDRTRLALIDHVTSVTALVLPIERIVTELAARGVDTLVDGAHAPGMVPLDLTKLNAAYYTGNCHKWLCAPKGAAFLHVRRDRQAAIAPTVVSHGWNKPRPGRSRLHNLFDWVGTIDPTPWLCVKDAIGFMGSLLPGGFDELMDRNRKLALAGRRVLCEALGIGEPAPGVMIGSLATVPLPDDPAATPQLDHTTVPTPTPMLQVALYDGWGIEAPVNYWPAFPRRILRISAQVYNEPAQYERLASALVELLSREKV